MCATTPAEVAGISNDVGGIEIGKRGDFLLFGLKTETEEAEVNSDSPKEDVLPPLDCTLVGGKIAWALGPYTVPVE